MKSLTKSIHSKLVSHDVHAQFSLPVANVLRHVRSAFFGLCINAGKAVLVALGLDAQGKKPVLGIREGSTEKMQVVRALRDAWDTEIA